METGLHAPETELAMHKNIPCGYCVEILFWFGLALSELSFREVPRCQSRLTSPW